MQAYTIKNKIAIISILACCLYSFFIGLCFYFDTVQEKKTTMEVARNRALTVFKKDMAFRSWAAENGGVYIFQNGIDSPHAHLQTTPEREFLTPSGKTPILVNPASTCQQVSENFYKLNGKNDQLPSLKIFNRNTATDGWERKATAQLSAGSQEVFLTALSGNNPVLRLIKPIRLRKNCLRCHGPDGHKEGDTKSIVSITVPLQPYLERERENIKFLFLLHFAFWMVGVAFILAAFFWGRHRVTERTHSREALLKSENDLRSIFNNSPMAMVILDNSGEMLSFNHRFSILFGFGKNDIRSMTEWWEKLFPEQEYRNKVKKWWSESVVSSRNDEKKVKARIWTMARKNGDTLTVEFSLVPLTEMSVITLNDISIQKQAREALQVNEERFKDAQRLAHVGHWEFNLKTRQLICSEEIFNIFEMKPEQFKNSFRPFLKRIHPEDKKNVFKTYTNLLSNKTPRNISHRLLLPNGRIKFIQAIFRTKHDDHGTPVCTLGTVQDITARKEEETLRIRLQTAIEHTAESIVITDNNGRIQYVNPSFEKITGYSKQEAVGKNPRVLRSGRHNQEFYRKMWKTLCQGKVWKGHFINRKKDGSFYEEEATISPIFNSDGKITAFVAVKRDVTEQLSLEKQLRQTQKMEAIGTLAGGIAHDFNNILAAILGYAEMAREDCLPDSTIADDLDKILTAGHRARDLVQQILAFSRQTDTERILFSPEAIVKESIKILRPSIPTTIEIHQNIEPDIGSIHADPTQFNQILMNLCTNAYHVMEKDGGKLTISLKRTTLEAKGPYHGSEIKSEQFIQLTVQDTGPGIPRELKEKIFEPYFTTKKVGQGTGMGLAIVHGIVRSLKGMIEMESPTEGGAAFHVYLPVFQEKAVSATPIANKSLAGHEKILLVDDEEMLVNMGKDMLERLGYSVTVKRDGKQALEEFRKHPDQYDIIITDQTMPGMTGVNLSQEILTIRPDMPVILCSGYSSIISEDKAAAIGIRKYIMKPVTRKTIARIIREILDNR